MTIVWNLAQRWAERRNIHSNERQHLPNIRTDLDAFTALLGEVIAINQSLVKDRLDKLVKNTVEEIRNGLH